MRRPWQVHFLGFRFAIKQDAAVANGLIASCEMSTRQAGLPYGTCCIWRADEQGMARRRALAAVGTRQIAGFCCTGRACTCGRTPLDGGRNVAVYSAGPVGAKLVEDSLVLQPFHSAKRDHPT